METCVSVRRSKWRIGALVAAVGGAALTLAGSYGWMLYWSHSGVSQPVGEAGKVTLPAGTTLVYYESRVEAPSTDLELRVADAQHNEMALSRPRDDNDYRLAIGGWSGRAVWEAVIEQPGEYQVHCTNAYHAAGRAPAGDRVTFFKQPQTLAEADQIRRAIQYVGGGITLALIVLCYVMAARAGQGRQVNESRA